jgi:hypothetical protein
MAFPVWDDLICCIKKAAESLTARVTAAEATLAGMAFGNATLVGGTATIANTNITANSIIVLNTKTVGGTQGLLSYTLDPGVGFDIDSDEAADTSVVSFVIRY